MPNRHWIIAYNILTEEYRYMRLFEQWLPFKYCAQEDIQPDWEQVGVYETEQGAIGAYVKLLQK
jgi:hypothetical protein